ncbi:MAG: hypothetical protein E4H36_08865 [Spirochaetales bacterium]|nr:MAG: hypothetical protein E4H36_08865 [Spirochaetales bacterium]
MFLLLAALGPVCVLQARDNGPLVSFETESLTITFHSGAIEREKLMGSLNEGFTTGVQYTVKVFSEKNKNSRLLGKSLIMEKNLSFSGSWDPFSKSYFIDYGNSERRTFRDFSRFLDSFFSCDIRSVIDRGECTDDIYILFRVQFDYIKLHPPLTMLIPVLPYNRITSSWVRVTCAEILSGKDLQP